MELRLPPAPKPVGAYKPVLETGNLAFLSGQISKTEDGNILAGKAGSDVDLDQAKAAARVAALNVISLIRNAIGFDRFDGMVRATGYIQAAPTFYEIPQVMDAASELFLKVFGDQGLHARSAVGTVSLPLNATVEIEATVKLKAQ